MNFLKKACIALLFLLPASGSTLFADRYYDDGACCKTDCCQSYGCSCEPLVPCAWDVQLQAGVAPIIWTHRDLIRALDCSLQPAEPLVNLVQFPRFSKLFKVPWTVGGQIGYALDENIRIYADVNYLQARGKNDVTVVTDVLPAFGVSSTFIFNFHKYRLVDFHLGFRYYFDRWCDLVSLFIGAKAGFTHYNHTVLDFDFSIPVGSTYTGFEIFQRHTSPSGGLNIGLDFCLGCNWYLALTAEFVASCGPRVNFDFIPLPLAIFRNFFFGAVGPEIRFPITLALRYAF